MKAIRLIYSKEALKIFSAPGTEVIAIPSDKYIAALFELHEINYKIWNNETNVRRAISLSERVKCKETIDSLNLARNNKIELIDTILCNQFIFAETAVPHTETPGIIYDRLSVLYLRQLHMKEFYASKYVTELLIAISCAFDFFLDELQSGEKKFIPFRQLKIYG